MNKFYDIEIDSQVELENGKTLGKLEESKISVNDGNCSSGGAGGAMAVVNGIINVETMEIELADDAIEVLDKINADFNSGTIYPVVANLTMLVGNKEVITGCNMSSYGIVDGEVGLSFNSSEIDRGSFNLQVIKIGKLNGEWVTQITSASIPVNLS